MRTAAGARGWELACGTQNILMTNCGRPQTDSQVSNEKERERDLRESLVTPFQLSVGQPSDRHSTELAELTSAR